MCLCAHIEVMKRLVKGFGQVNWQDRSAPAIEAVLKENILQYHWYLGDSFLLFKGQGVLLASVKKAILSKKIISGGRPRNNCFFSLFCSFPFIFLYAIIADYNFMPADFFSSLQASKTKGMWKMPLPFLSDLFPNSLYPWTNIMLAKEANPLLPLFRCNTDGVKRRKIECKS